jgi:HAE1 family hydrophobic/amphiphilic exporter-1
VAAKRAALRTAILQAVEDRFRPIMMTSGTTVLALLPMALGLGEGSAMRAPMALAVIGGMVSSTLMTLVVIPVVYELIENLKSNHR